MATLEMVEKLKERANVSFEEAKEALERSNDDLLDAMIYLERKGKVEPPKNSGQYSSKQESAPSEEKQQTKTQPEGETAGQVFNRFFNWVCALIKKGNENNFEVWHSDQKKLSMPVTVMVLLMIFCFWVTLPLLVIGLFCNCHYRFRGPNIEKTGVNSVMDSAAKAAGNIKNDIVNSDQNKAGEGNQDKQDPQ